MKSLQSKFAILLLCFSLLLPTLASAHEVKTTGPAPDLQIALGQLLGEHAYLAIIAMQKGYDGSADFGDAAAALGKNTDDLSAAIASVYGQPAGDAFKPIWSSHIGYFVDYVKATVAKDEAGRLKAIAELEDYRMKQAEFFNKANPAFFDKTAIADGLKMHITHLLDAFNAYVNKDYDMAYTDARTAYAHMFMTAAALASGIEAQFPEKFPAATVKSPGIDLRAGLGQLLGEHATLAVLAMQKGINGAPDFAAAAGALGKNTDDLTAAIASVYGQSAGEAFKPIWSSHIGYFVDYVKATAAKDETGRTKAVAELEEYRMEQAEFFNMANPTYFKTAAIADGLKMHIDHLLQAFNAYVNKDYAKTYSDERTAYAHMFMTASALAGGIVAQFPEKFHGPAAPTSPTTSIWMKIGSGALTINGTTTWMDVAPFMKDGNTFIPLRYLGEAIGAEVTWDAATQTAWVKTGGNTATFWIGKPYMELNGQRKEIGTQIFLQGGRTQVPLRFITELLGWDVTWNESDWSIMLTKQMAMEMGHSH
ncbi:copper amine oxidase N-terminal domain-containing protein [Paenibacillus qinlingensis]|uniref:copper amine oxidase N-terminal domain-containing protein n=1 Tax=Paenibacillus qinlingensis TaxID=1837343 RepID=UPI0015672DE9|nr:copper amine oxidase N-terminal domain-containing protein [Paenibacillus qinlingensis]NQX61253.1 copper amine oxidase N-terminal domain-containing protein [Paenibacillus qinlingensis]